MPTTPACLSATSAARDNYNKNFLIYYSNPNNPTKIKWSLPGFQVYILIRTFLWTPVFYYRFSHNQRYPADPYFSFTLNMPLTLFFSNDFPSIDTSDCLFFTSNDNFPELPFTSLIFAGIHLTLKHGVLNSFPKSDHPVLLLDARPPFFSGSSLCIYIIM